VLLLAPGVALGALLCAAGVASSAASRVVTAAAEDAATSRSSFLTDSSACTVPGDAALSTNGVFLGMQ
jgi:hypothetical protein